MKIKLLLSFLFISQVTFAQTDKHIPVQGTKVSMIPPEGFAVAPGFSGFQLAQKGASIMINELPAPYEEMAAGFTAEALQTKGMTLVSKETIDLSDSKATLIYVTQSANGLVYQKQILLFGSDKSTVLINGIYPEQFKSIEGEIKASLLSVRYNALQNDDPREAATFSVSTEGTAFQVVKYMSGSLVYSVDGKIPTDKPTLIVGSSVTHVTVQNQQHYAEQRLKNLPRGEQMTIKESKKVTIDNMDGYAITALGKDKDDKDALVYQVMLFTGKGDYYIILGQANEEFEQYLQNFQTIAGTFKRKKGF